MKRYLVLVVLAACTDPAIDGRDDSFVTDGKSDTGGVAEGTPEAAAVLYVANTTSPADLVGAVGLAQRAADNLVAVRVGDDGLPGTTDDATFHTLAALDAVPFIGPIAFGKLLAYARDNDLVGDVPSGTQDPFDPASCAGPAMTMATARSLWNSGHAELGTYQLAVRTRTSATASWQPFDITRFEWRQDTTGRILLASYNGEIKVNLEARTCYSYYNSADLIVGTSCDGVGQDLHCSTYGEPSHCNYDGSDPIERAFDGSYITFNGVLADHCVQLISHSATTEVAVLQRF
jgi:hypothetical protein